MKIIAMIPTRIGSQHLKKKNLIKIYGIPLITHAIMKTKKSAGSVVRNISFQCILCPVVNDSDIKLMNMIDGI